MNDAQKPNAAVWRFDRTPILIGVLILPLAASGALGSVGFWFGPDGTLRLGTQSSRFVLVERDRRDANESAIAPTDEELESVPAMDDPTPATLRAVSSALALRNFVVLGARAQSAPPEDPASLACPPRAPPVA
ncbi:hypothetical protein GC173_00050 [bacterium]|nr:hypothetical protein [bacterium]